MSLTLAACGTDAYGLANAERTMRQSHSLAQSHLLRVYLKRIGFNPAICVKSIIATHWHDDHIRGLAQVFRECESADFCCSDALKDSEFKDSRNKLIFVLRIRPSGLLQQLLIRNIM
jgi:metal-dependent hydrolase (beta-lactamase superfamily II)